jgi:hypothetical protein
MLEKRIADHLGGLGHRRGLVATHRGEVVCEPARWPDIGMDRLDERDHDLKRRMVRGVLGSFALLATSPVIVEERVAATRCRKSTAQGLLDPYPVGVALGSDDVFEHSHPIHELSDGRGRLASHEPITTRSIEELQTHHAVAEASGHARARPRPSPS